jgi:hypothetical protein
MAQMWVFAGAQSRLLQPSHSRIQYQSRQIIALIEQNLFDKIYSSETESSVMPSVQTIVTLASFAAIASCVFAFSWVGLALLGF